MTTAENPNNSSKPNSRETSPLEAMSKEQRAALGNQLIEMAHKNYEAGQANEHDEIALNVLEAVGDAITKESDTTMTPSKEGTSERLFVASGNMSMEQIKKEAAIPTTDGRSFIIDPKQDKSPEVQKPAADEQQPEPTTPENNDKDPYSKMSLPELYAARMSATSAEQKHAIDIAMSDNISRGNSGTTPEAKPQVTDNNDKKEAAGGKLGNGWGYEVGSDNMTSGKLDNGFKYDVPITDEAEAKANVINPPIKDPAGDPGTTGDKKNSEPQAKKDPSTETEPDNNNSSTAEDDHNVSKAAPPPPKKDSQKNKETSPFIRTVHEVEPQDFPIPDYNTIQNLIHGIEDSEGKLKPKEVDNTKSVIAETAEKIRTINSQITELESKPDTDGTKTAKLESLRNQLTAEQKRRDDYINTWKRKLSDPKVVPQSAVVDPVTGELSYPYVPEVDPYIDKKNASDIREDQFFSGEAKDDWGLAHATKNIKRIQKEMLELDDKPDTDGTKAEKMKALQQELATEQETYDYFKNRPISVKKPTKEEREKGEYTDARYEDMSIPQLQKLLNIFVHYKDGTTTYNIIDEIIRKEAAEKRKRKPIPPEKKEDIKLEVVGGRSDDLLKEMIREAMKIDEQTQDKNRYAKSKNIFKAIASRIKHGTVFKQNTQMLKAKEILDSAREKDVDKNGLISFNDYAEILKANGIEPTQAQKDAFDKKEAAFLGMIKDNLDGLSKDSLDDPKQIKVRSDITAICLEYAALFADTTLTDDQRKQIEITYNGKFQEKISSVISGEVAFDPKVEEQKRKLELYADNASEILRNTLAISRHQNGMQELKQKLAEMEISICERQSGANNTYPTAQLERIDKLSKKWNVLSVIGKTSFVVGTWIATGVVAGLAVKGARSAQATGVSAALGAAGSLLGPAGTLIGIGIGVGASALWARYMARRRANEQAGLLSSNVEGDNGFALDRKGRRAIKQYLVTEGENKGSLKPDLTPDQKADVDKIMKEHRKETTMEQLKPVQESMADITTKLKTFMEPKPGLPADYDKNDANNYQVRNLNPAEKVEFAKTVSHVNALLSYQANYNVTANTLSDKMAKQNGLRRTLRSKAKAESRALNFFSAANQEAYLPELYQMSTFMTVGTKAVDGYKMTTMMELPLPDGTTKSITIGEYMDTVCKVENDTTAEDRVEKWQKKVNKYINKAGRKAAAIAGATTLLISTASSAIFAAIAEKQTGGAAETWLDFFNKNKGNTGPKTPVDVPCTTSNGKASFTLPDGTKTPEVGVQPDGSISAADEAILETTYGIKIEQSISSNGVHTISGSELLKDMNAQPGDVDVWNYNKIIGKSDGSEFGYHTQLLPDGSVKCIQDAGTSFNGSQSYDIMSEGAAGHVFMRFQDGGNLLVDNVPMQVVGDHLERIIPAGDLASFVSKNMLHNVGPAIVPDDGIIRSIAAIVGHSGSLTTETFSATIKAIAELPAEAAKKVFAFLTGVGQNATKSYLSGADGYGYKPGEQPVPGPVPGPTPGPVPDPDPNPGPKPVPPDPNPAPVPTPVDGTKKPGKPDFPEAANAEDTDVINENPPGKTKPPYNYHIDPDDTFEDEKAPEKDKSPLEKLQDEYDTYMTSAQAAEDAKQPEQAEALRERAQKVKDQMTELEQQAPAKPPVSKNPPADETGTGPELKPEDFGTPQDYEAAMAAQRFNRYIKQKKEYDDLLILAEAEENSGDTESAKEHKRQAEDIAALYPRVKAPLTEPTNEESGKDPDGEGPADQTPPPSDPIEQAKQEAKQKRIERYDNAIEKAKNTNDPVAKKEWEDVAALIRRELAKDGEKVGETPLSELDEPEFTKVLKEAILNYDENKPETVKRYEEIAEENSIRMKKRGTSYQPDQPILPEEEMTEPPKGTTEPANLQEEIQIAAKEYREAFAKASTQPNNTELREKETIARDKLRKLQLIRDAQKAANNGTTAPDPNAGKPPETPKMDYTARKEYERQVALLDPDQLEDRFQQLIQENQINPVHDEELQILVNALTDRKMNDQPGKDPNVEKALEPLPNPDKFVIGKSGTIRGAGKYIGYRIVPKGFGKGRFRSYEVYKDEYGEGKNGRLISKTNNVNEARDAIEEMLKKEDDRKQLHAEEEAFYQQQEANGEQWAARRHTEYEPTEPVTASETETQQEQEQPAPEVIPASQPLPPDKIKPEYLSTEELEQQYKEAIAIDPDKKLPRTQALADEVKFQKDFREQTQSTSSSPVDTAKPEAQETSTPEVQIQEPLINDTTEAQTPTTPEHDISDEDSKAYFVGLSVEQATQGYEKKTVEIDIKRKNGEKPSYDDLMVQNMFKNSLERLRHTISDGLGSQPNTGTEQTVEDTPKITTDSDIDPYPPNISNEQLLNWHNTVNSRIKANVKFYGGASNLDYEELQELEKSLRKRGLIK